MVLELVKRSVWEQPRSASNSFVEERQYLKWSFWSEAFIPRTTLRPINRPISQVSDLPTGRAKPGANLGTGSTESQTHFHDTSQQNPPGSFVVESDQNSGMAQALKHSA